MTIFIDSTEKQVVRERLWLPIFQKASAALKSTKLKYLCLPGADCIELKFLLRKNVLSLENTIAVERIPVEAALIQNYMSGNGKVFEGALDHLLENSSEFSDEFKKPFNVLNLDYYGSANPLGNTPATRCIVDVKKIIELQSRYDANDFCILLTFKANDSIKGFSEIISEIKPNLYKLKLLENKIKKTKDYKKLFKTIALEIFQIISIGFNCDYDVRLTDLPITYIGKPHITRMISYAFEFRKAKEDKSHLKTKATKAKYKAMDDAILKIVKTEFI